MAVHPKKVQIHRTQTPNNPPVGLLPGELSVEMNDPLKLWIGVPPAIDALQRRLLIDATAGYVLKSGDVMTGNLSIVPAAGPSQLVLKSNDNSAAVILDKAIGAFTASIVGRAGGITRWQLNLGDSSAEDGAPPNDGSGFVLSCFDDAGGFLFNPLTFSRTDGLGLVKGDPTQPLGIATKAYVDAGLVGASNVIRFDIAQNLTEAQDAQARSNIYAAPFDALAYNGIGVNGQFEISQALGPSVPHTVNGYLMDCWAMFKVGTMVPSAIQCPPATFNFPGYSFSLQIGITTAQAVINAGDNLVVGNRIEGYRMARLMWGTAAAMPITLGFWTAHHRTGVYGGSVQNIGQARSYTFNYTQAVADVPQWNTVTIPGDVTGTWDKTSGVGIYINFPMAIGSSFQATAGVWTAGNFHAPPAVVNGVGAISDVFRITGLVVLPGVELPTAARAPLLMRPIMDELRLCQRYYEKSWAHNGYGVTVATDGALGNYVNIANNVTGLNCPFQVEKRSNPTMLAISPYNGTGGYWFENQGVATNIAVTWTTVGVKNAFGYIVSTFPSSRMLGHWIADIRL